MGKYKWLLGIIIGASVTSGILYALRDKEPTKLNPITEYEDLLKQSESSAPLVINSDDMIESKPSLTLMLESGISTLSGVVKSVPNKKESTPQVVQYHMELNDKNLGINAVSPIELVHAFLINGRQVMLVGFDQGGNQCAREYQFVTISESTTTLSKVFGSCLPINQLTESNDVITISTPQNNPYLGDDFNYIYQYQNGEVKLISKPNKKMLRNKYANLTPAQIIAKATADGCYQDGVLLDDGACGSGRKYCTMFKNIRNPVKDNSYQILKEFCN